MTNRPGDGLAAWRATADREGLAVDDLAPDPVMSCRAWLQHPRDLGVFEPDGASFAT